MYFECTEETAKYYPYSYQFSVTLDEWIRSCRLLYFLFILELLTMPFALIEQFLALILSLLYVKSSCAVYKLTKTNGIVIGNAWEIRRKDNSCLLQYHTEKTWDKEREKKNFRHIFSFPNKPRHFISSHCSCKETCPVPPPLEERIGKLAAQA